MASVIKYPGKHDVMLGRGGESNYHSGNIAFRHMVQQYKERFRLGSRKEKNRVIDEVVNTWRNQDPIGRFVAKKKLSNGDVVWYDVGDDLARKRAAKSLAEWTPQAPQSSQHKRQRSDESYASVYKSRETKLSPLKRSRSTGNDDAPSTGLPATPVSNANPFNPLIMGSPTAVGMDTSSFFPNQQPPQQPFPGLPTLSLPLPQSQPEPPSDLGMLQTSTYVQHPQVNVAAQLLPQEDLVMPDFLCNVNQLSNLNINMGVLPLERIRMTIPTAAELSAEAFSSDDDKSDRSHESHGSNNTITIMGGNNKGFSSRVSGSGSAWYQPDWQTWLRK
ncbi:expressed unknown protein [Seminavis robusta]|uniref:DUF6824 domain-containing protein n=1 Tax=Seminavis robusta TaxID=568900 RepID=A0A9N8EL49_9STRA|nr:expressed unknown protein [Seminavis robusta]|eukprot:Sro1264_g257420.1 n/a (332) ;mRNA; r:30761-32162